MLDPRGVRAWPSEFTGKPQVYTYVDENRIGDHICYYSDLRKMRAHYPDVGHHAVARGDHAGDRGRVGGASGAGLTRAMSAAPSLLMLAFEFPPLEVVGVRRSAGLARHLPAFGIAPAVITGDRASLAAWTGQRLAEDDAEPGVPVYRVPCPLPATAPAAALQRVWQFFSLGGDLGTQWAPALSEEWPRILAAVRPAALYVSLPPFRLAPLALRLARESGLPLILDYRDHWTQWGHTAYATPLHYARELRDERACLEGAAAIIGVTTELVRDLQQAHPAIDRSKFHVVPNGWDEAESAHPTPVPARDTGTFVIGHAGRFYYSPEKRASVMDPWWRKRPQRWLQDAPPPGRLALSQSVFLFPRAPGAVGATARPARPHPRAACR